MPEIVSLRDQPGTQREYETIYIVQPEIESEQLEQINSRIRKTIEENRGKLLTVESWGKRKLAYEIRKHLKGVYLYWRYLAPPTLVTEIERNLKLLDDIIRFQTVLVDENVDPNARPSDIDDETFVAASDILPDEEDAYRARSAEEREEMYDTSFDNDDEEVMDDDIDDDIEKSRDIEEEQDSEESDTGTSDEPSDGTEEEKEDR
ncbi:MAG: 30S ribosomal protein S6 [Pseudomonadota bacterium]